MTAPQLQNLEQREAYQRLIETLAVLHRLATRLSSRAEIVGSVRQVQLCKHMQMTVQTETMQGSLGIAAVCTAKLIVCKMLPSLGCVGAAGAPFKKL